jgi:hypothetical protein
VYSLVPPPAPLSLEVGPADVWIGLKNSDDIGTSFDLRAEVFQDGVLVASGQLDGVSPGGSGFNKAKLRKIAVTPGATMSLGSTLSVRLSVRISTTCGGHRSGTARLWFNDAGANTRLEATNSGSPSDYYLLDGFALAKAAGSGPKKTIDVLVDRARNGNAFKPFGTWSVVVQ